MDHFLSGLLDSGLDLPSGQVTGEQAFRRLAVAQLRTVGFRSDDVDWEGK